MSKEALTAAEDGSGGGSSPADLGTVIVSGTIPSSNNFPSSIPIFFPSPGSIYAPGSYGSVSIPRGGGSSYTGSNSYSKPDGWELDGKGGYRYVADDNVGVKEIYFKDPLTGMPMYGNSKGELDHDLGSVIIEATKPTQFSSFNWSNIAFDINNPTSTLKFTTRGFKTPGLTMKGYTTQTVYKSPSSSIETITNGKNGKPESINVKTGFLDFSISVGMDGSVTVGNSFVSMGSTFDGKGILDLSIPTGSHTSIGTTFYYNPDVFINNLQYLMKYAMPYPSSYPTTLPIPVP